MFDFWIDGQSGAARSGSLTLPHGTVETPVLMPVGTQATVRTLSPADLNTVGAEIVLANTYHLHVRPGEDVIAQLGGLHKFMAWERPLLTDSGGFQVFSLEGFRKVDEDGVEFQSHVDGGRRKLTPERAIEIQWTLGSDIAMAFDQVIPGGADEATARDALERTLRWLARCKKRHAELAAGIHDGTSARRHEGALVQRANMPTGSQTLWPILQGGTLPALRTECLDRVIELGPWTGIAIGGLSVGEPKDKMYQTIDVLEARLPPTLPRFLMGGGVPADLVAAVERWVDLFGCGAPTRGGRHGSAYRPERTPDTLNPPASPPSRRSGRARSGRGSATMCARGPKAGTRARSGAGWWVGSCTSSSYSDPPATKTQTPCPCAAAPPVARTARPSRGIPRYGS